MFKQRFSTKILSWSAGNLNLQVVLSGRKLFFPALAQEVVVVEIKSEPF